MSANEIGNTTPSVQQAPPPVPEADRRVVRAEEVQRELESNSPKTKPAPADEPYKGEAIDIYA